MQAGSNAGTRGMSFGDLFLSPLTRSGFVFRFFLFLLIEFSLASEIGAGFFFLGFATVGVFVEK